jgi:hypothetical protein
MVASDAASKKLNATRRPRCASAASRRNEHASTPSRGQTVGGGRRTARGPVERAGTVDRRRSPAEGRVGTGPMETLAPGVAGARGRKSLLVSWYRRKISWALRVEQWMIGHRDWMAPAQ